MLVVLPPGSALDSPIESFSSYKYPGPIPGDCFSGDFHLIESKVIMIYTYFSDVIYLLFFEGELHYGSNVYII